MPRASRRKASSPAAEVEPDTQEMDVDGEEHGNGNGNGNVAGGNALQFDEPLNWRAGKAIAVAELLRRLKDLSEELRGLQQEDVDKESVKAKAKELANHQLLGHKDSGVKAYAMLCIVEVFELTAPDAPFQPTQLKDIFTLFISTIVPALANPNDPYNQQHQEVLGSLARVKSIILIDDLPAPEPLLIQLFANCFDVISGNVRGGGGEQLSKNVAFNMTAILTVVLDECPVLPAGVVDILLAQFLRADPDALATGSKKNDAPLPHALREVSPAYNMARAVCNSAPDKMARHVGQYFNSVLIDATSNISAGTTSKSKSRKRARADDDEDMNEDVMYVPTEEDLQDAQKAHRLLRELWRSCPDVILNVIPQIEAEIAAENLPLRVMAVQTVGDMIAGIGAAGPPPQPVLDPVAYPSESIAPPAEQHLSVLLTPAAPLAFSSAYPSAYQAFCDRHRDKAPAVRAAWSIAVGRVLYTSGGGKGLDSDQEPLLSRYLADMLIDSDDKVRLAAVQAVAHFDYRAIMQKLGRMGSVSTPGSVLSTLADRTKDPKHPVRIAAMELVSRLWGVASGSLIEGSEPVRDMFGAIPTKVLDATYVNDKTLNALILRNLYDFLLPVSFPPIKSKVPDSQSTGERAIDPDRFRAQRILVLVRDLDERAKKVFYSLQQKQGAYAKYFATILELGEKIHAGADQDSQCDDKKRMKSLITAISSPFPDPVIASKHITEFVNRNERRDFVLARFCMSPESDYKKVVNAMKELSKRLQSAMPAITETLVPFLRSCSILVYNRSHVPAIMEISRSDEIGLGSTAHEVLKEISANAPQVFKVHIKELCETLKKQAPSATELNDPTAVQSLKACAGFARQFPQEMGQDREFYKAMSKFAMFGTPPTAAKHAVSVIVASADKKEMYIKDIVRACLKDFEVGSDHYLSRLAALSQLRLVASEQIESQDDEITQVLSNVLLDSSATAYDQDLKWSDEIDDNLAGKLWALKAIANKLRGHVAVNEGDEPGDERRTTAEPIFRLLNTFVEREGEISETDGTTAPYHRAQLRLAASKHLLKLCCNKALDRIFSPRDFNRLTKTVQDEQAQVRSGFMNALRKYSSQNRLPRRFYGLMFVYAFEPDKPIRETVMAFLKSRATTFAKQNNSSMELVFSNFLSLLAHHQDFGAETKYLKDFVDYIVFYLKIVATEANLPVIYSIAQRMKTVQDGIDADSSSNLYVLSDLAEGIIRIYQEQQGWSLQILSTKTPLPPGIFSRMPNHTMAQEIAETRFIPEDLADQLEDLVKDRMRKKKRKAEKTDASSGRAAKKVKATATDGSKSLPVRKASKTPKAAKSSRTPKKSKTDEVAAASSVDRRKSGRASNARNYAENDDSDDDEELEQWQAGDEEEDEDDNDDVQDDADLEERDADVDAEGNKENLHSTPPTSDPAPRSSTPRTAPPVTKKAIAAAKKRKAAAQTSEAEDVEVEEVTTQTKSQKKKATKQPPTRAASRGRSTRTAKKVVEEKKEKTGFDFPNDSDGELSDVPDEMEA
ncbi:sister chromatid cohesion and DNA repair protein (BimD) [Zymoseptoria brevis]|uniref:Sister chromatid cohesion and DNA repair protein (BimD) n=1 Tax=Zymoseptoria brevis TaxID=1047168 RepID=A0A0F4GAY5_9PEZI|nr:sister chromatid cohesion and DNA repair protein (BimD) [Zymoseptoria brevis]